MPQDAYTLNRIAKELKDTFVGGKISKINQPEKDTLSFIIYTKRGSVKLDICASAKRCRISLSRGDLPNPKTAPNFCMLLRKHLQNAEITDVEQVGFERMIRFDFDCFSEFSSAKMNLYCEIMGKYSNVILCENGVIVGAMKTTSLEENAKRITFGGAKYVLPAPQDKVSPLDLNGLEELFGGRRESADFIFKNVAGIAYSTALEMENEYGGSVSAEQVYKYVTDGDLNPCVVFCDGKPTDFKARSVEKEKKEYGSVLEAQAAYYEEVLAAERFAGEKRKLSSALDAARKKVAKGLAKNRLALSECASAELIKLKAELITANIYAIERGMKSFEAVNYYDENAGKIKIDLDAKLTPAQNAQKYYKKYQKLKRTAEVLTERLKETEERESYLNGIYSSIATADDPSDLLEIREELIALGLVKADADKKKKEKPCSPFKRFLIGGCVILAGANNASNDRLTKSLSQNDLWLHAQKFHSSHVAIICPEKSPPENVILAAAEICAYYSEARDNAKVPVDYALKAHVKKPPKSPLGFAVYTDYKTIIVAPNAHSELRDET